MKNPTAKRIVSIVLVVLLFILSLLFWWLKPDNKPMAKPNMVTTTQPQTPNLTPPQVHIITNKTDTNPTITGLENLPKSLQGTQVDGEIIINEQHQLIVTRGLRRLFDYFLSALGEETEETIHTRVYAYISSHTPKPAASQAILLYQAYVNYLKALTQLESGYGHLQMQATAEGNLDMSLITQRQQQVKSLRQQYFNQQTITAFFADDDALENYAIAMIQINQNANLTEQQKQEQQQQYINRMPNSEQKKHLRIHTKQQANIAELLTKTQQMKALGATDTELYAMREQLVGSQAAKRLADMDKQDADFDQRFEKYQTEKQAIISQYGSVDDSQAITEIKQLTNQLFTPTEAKRLEGYAILKQTQ